MSKLERASFGSKLGVILATAGSAVGLGNIWRFPYMTGQNGGAVFIIIYIFCVLLLGIPCMISEFIIGRHGQANTARAFSKISGGSEMNFHNPYATIEVIEGIERYMSEQGIENINEIIGAVE